MRKILKSITRFLLERVISETSTKQEAMADDALQEQEASGTDLPDNDPPSEDAKQSAGKFLAKYGIKQVGSQDDADRVLWEMAVHHKKIDGRLAESLRVIISDDQLAESFNHKLDMFNRFMDTKFSTPEYMSYRRQVKELEKQHRDEVVSLQQTIRQREKEINIIRQKLEGKEGAGRRTARKFINLMKGPRSKFHQVYDFTKAEDVEEFLSWFRLLKLPVPKRTVKGILRYSLAEAESYSLFLNKVEVHNSRYAGNGGSSDEEDSEWED